MLKVKYNANPHNPKHLNHLGSFRELTVQDEKNFDNLNEAVDFWFNCSSPITSLIEFKKEFKKQYPQYSEEELNYIISISEVKEEDTSTEVILLNQKQLYNFEGE